MDDPVHRLLGEALGLSHDDRARIVTELLATLEPDVPSQGHSEVDWIREVELGTARAWGPSASGSVAL